MKKKIVTLIAAMLTAQVFADSSGPIDAKSITGVSIGYFNDGRVYPVVFESKDGTIYKGEAANVDPSTGYFSTRLVSKCQKNKCQSVKGFSVSKEKILGLKTITTMPPNVVLLNQYAALTTKLIQNASDSNSSSASQTFMIGMMKKTQPVMVAEPQEVKLFEME